MEQTTIKSEIERFVVLMNGFFVTVQTCTPVLGKEFEKAYESLRDLHSKSTKVEHTDNDYYVCSIENRIQCSALKKKVESINASLFMLPPNIFCAMYNTFENYLSNLYRLVLKKYPSILNSSNSKFTYSDIVEAGSVENIVIATIDREILNFTHGSLKDQIEMIEKRFKVDLIYKNEKYKDTLKLSLQRNVFTHNAGIINTLYLDNLKILGCESDKYDILGKGLHFCPGCFKKAYALLFMAGIRIGHNLWRKICDEERSIADESLISIGYDLLEQEKFDLAKIVLEYSCSLQKYSDEATVKLLTINFALAYYLSGDSETAKKILSKQDWSAVSNLFLLAVDIINERYEKARNTIIRFKKEGPVAPYQYYQWPLFKKFRETDFFYEAMKDIGYDPSYCSVEPLDKDRYIDSSHSNFI